MYISRVALTTCDTYEQHQAIWSLFPDQADRKREHLFRVENELKGQVLVLLQSASEPQSSSKAQVIQSKIFNVNLVVGNVYKFKVLANPTRCLSNNKKVVEIKDEAEQIIWLQRKLSGGNITITSMESKLVKSKKSYTSRFVCFEGILQINNAEQVYSALIMGIGRKKYAGAGLLSLARMPVN